MGYMRHRTWVRLPLGYRSLASGPGPAGATTPRAYAGPFPFRALQGRAESRGLTGASWLWERLEPGDGRLSEAGSGMPGLLPDSLFLFSLYGGWEQSEEMSSQPHGLTRCSRTIHTPPSSPLPDSGRGVVKPK